MARTIAINGTKLDEVRMLMDPDFNGTAPYSTYRMNQFRVSQNGQQLRLVVPTDLAVELYRLGILPQDTNLPAEILIGRHAHWYIVSDVRHSRSVVGPPQVNFTFIRVIQENAPSVAEAEPARYSAPSVEGAYVTDITHYLDETGELMPLPGPARKLASFLVLVVEAATSAEVGDDHATGIRCRKKSCQGTIRTLLLPDDHEVFWRCPVCEHHGVIRNWQNTKWNQLKGTEESR